MADFLQNLLKKRLGAGYDYSAPSYENEYDNGEIWDSAPEQPVQRDTSEYESAIAQFMPDVYKDFVNKHGKPKQQVEEVVDPLEAPRNQVNYYTKQLEQAGEKPEEPGTWSKVGSGALKALEGVTLVPASIVNVISGAADSLVKSQDKSILNKSIGEVVGDVGKAVGSGLKSGGATYKAFIDEDARKDVVTFADTFKDMMNSKNGVLNKAGNVIAREANPIYNISKAMGSSEEKATSHGLLGADLLTNLLIPTPDKVGKALKYMQGADKVKDAEAIGGDIAKATKLARESNNIDDYAKTLQNANKGKEFSVDEIKKSYDNYIDTLAQKNVQQTTKALGGMTDFQGITLGGKTILGREALDKLASNKVTNALTQTGLGLYSPVGAFINNPITNKVTGALGETKIGGAVKETVQDAFVNPYKTAMRQDTEKALEYGNSMIQDKQGQNILRQAIANDIDEIKGYAEQKDQTPQNITNTVEDVKTKYTETETPMQVINDDYANLAKKKAYGDYKGLQDHVAIRQKELDTQITEAKAKGIDVNDLENQKRELTTINDELSKAQASAGTNFSKSVKNNEHLSHLDDKQINNLMNDSLKSNTSTLTDKLIDDYGVEDKVAQGIAIKLRKDANGVLNDIDKQSPGMSKYFSGLKQEDLGETFKDAKNASTNPRYLNQWLDKNGAKELGINTSDHNAINKMSNDIGDKILKGTDKNKIVQEYSKKLGLDEDKTRTFLNMMVKGKKATRLEDNKVKATNNLMSDLGLTGSKRQELNKSISDVYEGKVAQGRVSKVEEERLLKDLEDKRTGAEGLESKGLNGILKYIKNDLGSSISEKDFRKRIGLPEGKTLADMKTSEARVIYGKAKQALREELGSYEKYIKGMIEKPVNPSYMTKSTANKIYKQATDLGYDIENKEAFTKALMDGDKSILNKDGVLDEHLSSYYRKHIDTMSESDLINAQSARAESAVTKNVKDKRTVEQKIFDDAHFTKSSDTQTIKPEDFDTNKGAFDDKNAKEYINKPEDVKYTDTVKLREDLKGENVKDISPNNMLKNHSIDDVKQYLKEEIAKTVKDKDTFNKLDAQMNDWSEARTKVAFTRAFDKQSLNEVTPIASKQAESINRYMKASGNAETIGRNIKLLDELGVPRDANDWSVLDKRNFFGVMNARDNVKLLKANDEKLYKELADMTENFTKVDGATLDYMNNAAFKFRKASESSIKTPINALLKQSGIDTPKNTISTLEFETPKGTIKVEEGIRDLSVNMDDLNGATITLSKSLDDSLQGLNKGENVLINANAKNVQGVIKHELNHRLQELYKGTDEIQSVSKGIEDTIKTMTPDKQKELIDIINNEGVDKATIDLISQGHLTENVSFAGDNIQASKETVATYASLIYSSNNATKLATKKLLGDENYNNFVNNFSNLEPKAFKEAKEFTRLTVGQEQADNMQKIYDINKLVKNKEDIGTLTQRMDKAQDVSNNLHQAFSLADDHPEFIKAKEDAIKYYKQYYPKLAQKAEKQFGKYKEIFSTTRVMEKFHDTSKLTSAEKNTLERYVEDMRQVALKEGIFNEDGAEAYKGYVYHMLKGDIEDTKQIKEYLNKMGFDMKSPTNIHAKERKYEGTIKELNNDSQRMVGKQIFEDNIYRMWAQRKINHEKFMYKKNSQETLVRDFGHEVIRDFSPEALVKSGRVTEAELEAIRFAKNGREPNKNDMAKFIIQKEGLNITPKIEEPNFPTHSPNGMEYAYVDDIKKLDSATIKAGRDKGILYVDKKGKGFANKPNYVGGYMDYIYKDAKANGYSIVEKQALKGDVTDEQKFMDMQEAMNSVKSGVEYSDVNLQNINPDNKKLYIIKTNAFNIYKDTVERTFNSDKSAFLKAYDNVMGVFKSQALLSGKFHVNNTIGNIFNSYVTSGVNILNPAKNKQAYDVLKGKSGKIGDYTYDEIRAYLTSSGTLSTQVADQMKDLDLDSFIKSKTSTIKTVGEQKSPLRRTLSKINPLNREEFVPYKANFALGGKIEEQAKVVNLLTHLDNGFNLAQAEELTQKALFDYSDLTQFETNVLKRIVPFYTYMSKNVGLQLDNMMNAQSKLRPVNQLYQNAKESFEDDKTKALKPEYIKNYLPIGDDRYLNAQLPFLNLFQLTDPSEMASGISPLIKTPLEVLTNKQLYSGADISKTNKSEEKAQYALESLIPLAKRLRQFGSDGTVEGDKKSKEQILSFAGNIETGFDQAKAQKQTMYEYVTQLQNQYYDLIENNPGLKEKLAEIQEQEAYNKKQATKNKKTYNGYLNNLLNNKR